MLAALALAAATIADPRAFVLLGDGGVREVRVATAAGACPTLTVDGRTVAMRERAPPATLPGRRGPAGESAPAAFPRVCEATLPAPTRSASLSGRRLPLGARMVRRIAVIGDTGCRLKAARAGGGEFQACNDPAQFPLARIAASATRWKPDLVVHVGDYHYRESPCPADNAGCAASPWGYGWEAWEADLFTPAAPLIAAAPWLAVRGNHENCARAGSGWQRLLAPGRLTPERSCDAPGDDRTGDRDPAVTLPLGGGARIVDLDLANAPNDPLPPGDLRLGQIEAARARLGADAARGGYTIMATHRPPLAFAADARALYPGNGAIQQGFHDFPRGVGLVLSGHVHVWEQLSFTTSHPSQFVVGLSGTAEDLAPLPDSLAPDQTPMPGAVVERFDHWVGRFGWMSLTRVGRSADRWTAELRDTDGRVVKRCRIAGRRSACSDV
ncbi:MAG: metallophosphoesterase [Sphingomonadaceae bacterium]|nr:metallophosphoesterase [Sphingomonadaceae bacterium]